MTDLKAAAKAALARPRFQPLLKMLTPEERSSARTLLLALGVAAEVDPRGADSDDFRSAHAALGRLVAAERLQHRIATAYHDPALRARYGDEAVERAWSNPAVAKDLLLKESAGGRLSPESDAALRAIYDAEAFASEHGESLPQAAAAPIPSGDALDTEYRDLVDKTATGRPSAADAARLTQLGQARAARDFAQQEQAERTPQSKPAVPDEYQRLIAKSSTGKLTDAEHGRLTGLAQERAVAAGLAEPEDFAAEEDSE